jgi:hypothetical protein
MQAEEGRYRANPRVYRPRRMYERNAPERAASAVLENLSVRIEGCGYRRRLIGSGFATT